MYTSIRSDSFVRDCRDDLRWAELNFSSTFNNCFSQLSSSYTLLTVEHQQFRCLESCSEKPQQWYLLKTSNLVTFNLMWHYSLWVRKLSVIHAQAPTLSAKMVSTYKHQPGMVSDITDAAKIKHMFNCSPPCLFSPPYQVFPISCYWVGTFVAYLLHFVFDSGHWGGWRAACRSCSCSSSCCCHSLLQ